MKKARVSGLVCSEGWLESQGDSEQGGHEGYQGGRYHRCPRQVLASAADSKHQNPFSTR